MLRALVVLALVVAALWGLGWLSVHNTPNHVDITLDKTEMQRDVDEARETVERQLRTQSPQPKDEPSVR